ALTVNVFLNLPPSSFVREQVAKIVSKNDPDTKKLWCKYGKIPGQGDGVNLFFVGEINVTHYFITNIGAGLPDACAE
ncbi:hypothetical protein PJ029_26405, partial [Escherichia coli]|uniref:hypothetical protein n=1 Tax=Escherichia coli TaxID=562 RepID=UPI002300C295